MEDKKQKNIIYIAVGIIAIIVIGFYICNWDFVMNGGFRGEEKLDESWENLKKSFGDSFGKIKNQIEEAKNNAATSTEKDARLLEILKDRVNREAASGTTSTVK